MVSDLRTAHPVLKQPATRQVIYTAAHGGFDLTRVPLGGAAAICDLLTREWTQQKPFDLKILTPAILGSRAPQDNDLVNYSELRYARFCLDFNAATTREILKHNPKYTSVLINDVSEGPDFQLLARRGYLLHTIYHVNVADYFAEIYLRGWIGTQRITRYYEQARKWGLTWFFPKVLKLVFDQQRDSLAFSRVVIVPSEGMKQVLLRCYPETRPEKIRVMPWGISQQHFPETPIVRRSAELRKQYGIPKDGRVLITLSRISPEKGQDRLLEALIRWEKEGDLPEAGLWLFLCGEPAYMQGRRFAARLHKLARRLKKIRVIFPGYLSGLEKQAYFRLSDLYVFPSRHESFGLTLLEAMNAGLPAVACAHYGSEGLLRPDFGEILPVIDEQNLPESLKNSLKRLLLDRQRLKSMGQSAREFAKNRSFAQAAQQIAQIILT